MSERNSKGQFPKGITGNKNGRAGKAGVMEVTFSAAENMPESIKPASKKLTYVVVQDWENWGVKNDYPEALADLNRKSPTHRGILNWKTIYLSGRGFETGNEKGIEDNSEFAKWLENCNASSESFKKVIRKVIFDKLSSGNGFLEFVRKKGTNTINAYHKDYTTCRVAKNGEEILLYGDWANLKYEAKKDIKAISIYPKWSSAEKGFERSIIHFKDYEPQFKNYGVASWIAGMDAAGIAYKTNKWNISRLDNSFSSSRILSCFFIESWVLVT